MCNIKVLPLLFESYSQAKVKVFVYAVNADADATAMNKLPGHLSRLTKKYFII